MCAEGAGLVSAESVTRSTGRIPGRKPTIKVGATDDPGSCLLGTGKASRVLCPRRCGASTCSVGDRSATRSTRSARSGEPCGPARLHGDGSRSSRPPSRGESTSAAVRRRTAGVNPLAPGSRCDRRPAILRDAQAACVFYPFTTPIGSSRATFRPIPAPWTTSTTWRTSLYASGISSSTVRRLAARTRIPRSASS